MTVNSPVEIARKFLVSTLPELQELVAVQVRQVTCPPEVPSV